MKTVLTKGLDKDKAGEVLLEFSSSAFFRQRLEEVMKEKIESSQKAARSRDRYLEPSWALNQADAIGYERALNEVISLISSKPV